MSVLGSPAGPSAGCWEPRQAVRPRSGALSVLRVFRFWKREGERVQMCWRVSDRVWGTVVLGGRNPRRLLTVETTEAQKLPGGVLVPVRHPSP